MGRAQLRRRRRRRARQSRLAFGVALLTSVIVVRALLLQAFFIPSESMQPTLEIGDRVVVNKLAYDVGDVDRGDVVVFDGRGSFLRADSDGGGVFRGILAALGLVARDDHYVKRVIGLPGDRVRCCDADGLIRVNGQPLNEPYLYPGDVPSRQEFDVRVPPGRLWVMGDHRSESADSRAHLGDPGGGTVPIDRVVGRAFVTVWPFDRLGRLGAPDGLDSEDGRANGE